MVEALQGGIEHAGEVGIGLPVAVKPAREGILQDHETGQHQGLYGSTGPEEWEACNPQRFPRSLPLVRVLAPAYPGPPHLTGWEIIRDMGEKRRYGGNTGSW